MALRLLLARHGETEWNAAARVQGQTDTPLSAQGERQARALGRRLAGEPLDAIFASDLQRTWRTAELAVGDRGLAIQRVAAWRELSFGEWEGLDHDAISRRDPDLAARRLRDPAHVAPPGGEHLTDLRARVFPEAERLRDELDGRSVLVVTSGGPLRVLACALLGMDLNLAWRVQASNCGLSVFRWYESGPVLDLWNETQHLRDL